MGQSFQGPQGVGPGAAQKIDSGTMALTTSAVPGVTVGSTCGKQRFSWSRKLGEPLKSEGDGGIKLAEIFFRTAEDALDADDAQALNELCDQLLARLREGYRFDLICRGNADFRASDLYNFMLGKRRAEAVKRHIETFIRDAALKVWCESEGEAKAVQPASGGARVPPPAMEFDRRVDVVFGSVVPPLRMSISGNWMQIPSLEKLEVDSGGHIYDATRGRPTVMVRAEYRLEEAGGAKMARVDCTVSRVDTGTVLFATSASVDADRPILRKGYKTDPKSRVTRVLLPGSEAPPPGATLVDVVDRERFGQAASLVQVVFDRLRGSHRTLTEHVQAVLEATRRTP